MKKYIFYIIVGLSAVLNTACKENEMEPYKDTPALYFQNIRYGQADSISQSFFVYGNEVTEDTVWVVVNTMGYPENTDRPISLAQTNAGKPGAAVPGTHFISFDDPKLKPYFCIPANKVSQKVPIVFLRDRSLLTDEYRIELTITENEYFRPGIDAWRNFVVTTTDQAVKPNNWDTTWIYVFGSTWGREKMKFIIQVTGYTEFHSPPMDPGYRTWLGQTAKLALIKYNLEHPNDPLCEASGEEVTFD